jgi:hypothetical protein
MGPDFHILRVSSRKVEILSGVEKVESVTSRFSRGLVGVGLL